MPADTPAVLVYDGDCGFCTTSAAWMAARWKDPTTIEVRPWQQLGEVGLERLGLTVDDVSRAAWWVKDGRTSGGHLAVARALMAAGGGWGLVGRVLLVPPVRSLAGVGYRVVARNRYRLPGATPSCTN
ncbi:MAG TPA: DUF393 domain-containing protein [Acidimicrobiales bacterium]|nr:DUF393 domain-containing protein [Acidimicrobiales bacterium]